MTVDKRLIGEQNELAILFFLHRFGWLTGPMLAAIVWPHAKQALAMARRTVKAMTDEKIVLKRALPEGGYCYVLSAAGARQLNEREGLSAKGGNSLQLGNPTHRACSNWYLINRYLAGDTIWTEHEIQSGRAPVVSISGKTPDGLVETAFGLVWVEVENSWKNKAERAKIIRHCQRCLVEGDEMTELSPGHYLFRVAVISTNPDAMRAMLRSLAEAYTLGDLSETQVGEIELVVYPIDKSLAAGEIRQCLLADLIDEITP